MKQYNKIAIFFSAAAVIIFSANLLNIGIPKAHAHGKGPPYVKLNGQYLTTNPIVNAMGLGFAPTGSITLGSDSTSSAYLINQELTFEIDETYFPNPYQQFNPFSKPSDQKSMQVIYQWDFADGSKPVEGQTVTHTYTKAGTFVIDLKVKYPEKSPDFTPANTMQLDIVPSADYQRPVAKIKINDKLVEDAMRDTVTIKPALPIPFDASLSTGKLVKYQWDFGDEKSGIGKTIKHRYSRDTYFPVPVLRVTDENNLVSDAYVLLDLPFGGGNPIQKIWYAIADFFTSIFYR